MQNAWLVGLALAACGGGGGHAGADAHVASDGAPSDAASCNRVAAAADRVRHVVVSRPYDAAGNAATTYEVLDLSTAGALSRPNVTFSMGTSSEGVMAFTIDGQIGVVPQDDGSLGIVRLADDGTPTVVSAGLTGTWYATGAVIAPSGDRVYVVDYDTRANGGGIYAIDLACDGTPTDRGLVAAAGVPAGLAFVPGTDRAMIAATDFATSMVAGDTAQLVTLYATPGWIGGANAFGDAKALVGATALSFDAQHYLIGDTSQFSGIPNRVAVVEVDADGVTAPQVISNVGDPEAILASPFGDVALVADGFGNAFHVLRAGVGGWTLAADPTYVGASPQLPAGGVVVQVGSLKGLALVGENVGVRSVMFGSDGSVTDKGAFDFGDGLDQITGSIGITP